MTTRQTVSGVARKSPTGSPQGRPEDGRHDDGEGREARAGPVEPGLDDVVADELGQEEQPDHPQQHRPAGIDRDREGDREQRGQERAEIGHEAQDGGQHAPQDRIGHPDEIEGKADGDAIGEVHDQLHEQVAAHPPGRIVESVRALLKVSCSGKLDEAVPQVLLLEQHEDHEDHDEARRGDRGEQRADHGLDHLERLRLGASSLTVMGSWRAGPTPRDCFARSDASPAPEISLLRSCRVVVTLSTRPPPGARGLESPDLVGDGRLVGGEVLGELDELPADDERDAADQDEGEAHGDQNRGDPGQLQPAQPVHQGRQGKPEEDREGKGDEDVAAEIQPADGKNDPACGQKGRAAGRRDRLDVGRGRVGHEEPPKARAFGQLQIGANRSLCPSVERAIRRLLGPALRTLGPFPRPPIKIVSGGSAKRAGIPNRRPLP